MMIVTDIQTAGTLIAMKIRRFVRTATRTATESLFLNATVMIVVQMILPGLPVH